MRRNLFAIRILAGSLFLLAASPAYTQDCMQFAKEAESAYRQARSYSYKTISAAKAKDTNRACDSALQAMNLYEEELKLAMLLKRYCGISDASASQGNLAAAKEMVEMTCGFAP